MTLFVSASTICPRPCSSSLETAESSSTLTVGCIRGSCREEKPTCDNSNIQPNWGFHWMYIRWWIMLGGCVGRKVAILHPRYKSLCRIIDMPGVSVEWKPTTAHTWSTSMRFRPTWMDKIERGAQRVVWTLLICCYSRYKLQEMVGVGYDLQHAQKLATQLLAEGCYGTKRMFIRPVRSPPFMCFLCACACTGVEQVILTNVKRTHK